jgi:hypothetical protein
MIEATLGTWSAPDLAVTYRHVYQGRIYDVSRQWTMWRILAHDLHHGGELPVSLVLADVDIPELGDFGGHTRFPTLADPPSPA